MVNTDSVRHRHECDRLSRKMIKIGEVGRCRCKDYVA